MGLLRLAISFFFFSFTLPRMGSLLFAIRRSFDLLCMWSMSPFLLERSFPAKGDYILSQQAVFFSLHPARSGFPLPLKLVPTDGRPWEELLRRWRVPFPAASMSARSGSPLRVIVAETPPPPPKPPPPHTPPPTLEEGVRGLSRRERPSLFFPGYIDHPLPFSISSDSGKSFLLHRPVSFPPPCVHTLSVPRNVAPDESSSPPSRTPFPMRSLLPSADQIIPAAHTAFSPLF